MNLRRWLVVLAILLLANLSYRVWRDWGLITIDSDNKPLSEIVRSIEKQGHITLRSQLDPTTPVRMHVNKVPLAEALETLAAITDGNWQLQYILGPDSATLESAAATLASGTRPEGWKFMFYPLPPMTNEDRSEPADPRVDTWNPAPKEQNLQGYLESAARSVSASFAVPESWNPPVGSAPSNGKISTLIPKLAKASKSQSKELFLLTKSWRGDRGDSDDSGSANSGGTAGNRGSENRPEGGRPRGGEGFRGMNREAMEERMQAEIAKLPPEKRKAAQAELDERKAFFSSLQSLSPEERRAKIDDYLNRPDVQDRMEKRMAERDARRSPEQRIQRAQRYRERKQQMLNK